MFNIRRRELNITELRESFFFFARLVIENRSFRMMMAVLRVRCEMQNSIDVYRYNIPILFSLLCDEHMSI